MIPLMKVRRSKVSSAPAFAGAGFDTEAAISRSVSKRLSELLTSLLSLRADFIKQKVLKLKLDRYN